MLPTGIPLLVRQKNNLFAGCLIAVTRRKALILGGPGIDKEMPEACLGPPMTSSRGAETVRGENDAPRIERLACPDDSHKLGPTGDASA
jgi:hypothetical protein